MSFDEVIRTLIESNVVGGGAGGLIRSLSKEEIWQRLLVSTFVGATTAYHVAPFLSWAMLRYLGVESGDVVAVTAVNGFLSFCIGIVSFRLGSIIDLGVDKVLDKIMGGKGGKST